MSQPNQPQFTSRSLIAAWDATASALHDLLTGDYPRGLAGADRTYGLKHALEHLKAFLAPQLGAMAVQEQAASDAAAAVQAPATEAQPTPALAEPCAGCDEPSHGKARG